MDHLAITHIIECLPRGRTVYYYFRDRYALDLLEDFIGEGRSITSLKSSPLGSLLRKPLLKRLIADLGSGHLTPTDLQSVWPDRPEAFTLTLDRWGDGKDWSRSWNQMCRRGGNLVLQLNFSNRHDASYRRLVALEDDFDEGVFNSSCHPVNERGRLTLAWSRLDIDLDGGEALIEEIQSDWLREVRDEIDQLKEADLYSRCPEPLDLWFGKVHPRRFRDYVERVLAPYWKLWDEAILAATIQFLRHELGIDRIFYYTAETGRQLKGFGVNWRHPPRSLYRDLPRRFCFRRTRESPGFLREQVSRDNFLRCKLKNHSLEWFLLERGISPGASES